MNFHPQFFDRQQTLILNPLNGHAGLSCQCPCRFPMAFPAQAHWDYHAGMSSDLYSQKTSRFFPDTNNNIHALPGTTNHERTGQHVVLSYKDKQYDP
jgi:hypothetical protein